MALFGGKAKQPAKSAKGSKSLNLGADIDAINAATVVEEDDGDSALVAPGDVTAVPPLAHDRQQAYGTFAAEYHSDAAAKQRKLIDESPELDYKRDFDVTKVYVDGDGREFSYDEYGKPKYLDEVVQEVVIPESFADGVGSAQRAREEVEAARLAEEEAKRVAATTEEDEDFDDAPRSRRSSRRSNRSRNYADFDPAEDDEDAYDDSDDGEDDERAEPHRRSNRSGRRAAGSGNNAPGERFRQPRGTPTVNLKDPVDTDVAYRDIAEEVNRRRALGADASEFPTIDSTIASLVESSRTPEEITQTLLGYLKNVLAAEGVEATMKLLGEKNIYTPLLVSALKYNNEQYPIDPVALQELWTIEPEVVVEEKVVYVPQEGVPGEKVVLVNIPISLEELAQMPAPISDAIQARITSMQTQHVGKSPDATPSEPEVADSTVDPVKYDY